MDVKTRLQRLQLLDTVINQKLRELESLKALSTCVAGFDTSRERVQSSSSGEAAFVTPVLRIIALEQEINAEIDTFVDEKHNIADWNAGRIKVLLAHPASVGYGLNLQEGGHTIVWYGLTWSLELYQQANARLHRQGQEKPVIIHHLIATGTVDEQVMRALQSKDVTQASLMRALKERREHGGA